jgi:hypothetical protein
VCPYHCKLQPSICQDSSTAGFASFCFEDGEGTRVNIRGIGLTPTPDQVRIKINSTVRSATSISSLFCIPLCLSNIFISCQVYERDSYNSIYVSVLDTGDTVAYFLVPDSPSPGVSSLEIALNGIDFTSELISFVHMGLNELYQPKSIGNRVYGPEHSSVNISLIGGSFVYSPYTSQIEARANHSVLVAYAGDNDGLVVDHGTFLDDSCSDFYCATTAVFDSYSMFSFTLPSVSMCIYMYIYVFECSCHCSNCHYSPKIETKLHTLEFGSCL